MDETMSNYSGTANYYDTFTATTSTDSNYGNILSFTANTNLNFSNNYDMWPKGIQDPLIEFKYTPKWHIIKGYKNQITKMWD